MTRLLKRAVRQGLWALGLSLTPRWRLRNLELANHLRVLFELFAVDCVIDVGGNQGQYRDLLRTQVGYDGWIVSFEPVSTNAAIIRERALRDPRWRLCDYALGPIDGTSRLNVMERDSFSSFLEPSDEQPRELARHNRVSRIEEVQVRRLDAVWPALMEELAITTPYLKLDTQGFDLEVVEGARTVLSQIVAMQTEVSVRPIYQGMPDFKKSVDVLASVGFDVFGFFPVTRDSALRVVEFDCVLISRAATGRLPDEALRHARIHLDRG